MYTVNCKMCQKQYESGINRPGICPDCKKNARSKRNTKYRDKTYDRFSCYLPKGQKEYYQAISKNLDMSLNEYIVKAVNMYTDSLKKEGKINE